MKANCRFCKKEFRVERWQIAAGKGIYCSRSCYVDDSQNRPVRPIAERFWEKVSKCEGDGCWLWTGSQDDHGYGRISTRRGQSPRLATRVAWEIEHGSLDPAAKVLHTCDNPPCVRPSHLFLGTQKANIDDCIAKGRHARGRMQPHAILTESLVLELRRRYEQENRRRGIIAQMSRETGISSRTLASMLSGKRWAWLHD